MKRMFLYIAALLIVSASCKKNNSSKIELPWRYTLNDSNNAKRYGFVALGDRYPSNFFPNYTIVSSDGSNNISNGLISFYTTVSTLLSPSSELSITINLTNIDSITSSKLHSQTPLSVKQNTLKDIFATSKIIKVGNLNIPGKFTLLFSYSSEEGKRFNTNYFLLNSNDYLKILSSEIYNDGNNTAKIKALIEFDAHVQASANSTWLPEIRRIQGSMLTYFTVR